MYSGNAVVVNFLMRFPVLIPVVAAAGIVTQVPPETIAKVVPPAIVQYVAPVLTPAPVPVAKPVKPVIPALETICPPYEKTAKLKKAEKAALKERGCKVKG